MRDAQKYSWWEHDNPPIRTRVPRTRQIHWGPVIGAGLVVITGSVFWWAVYHWLVKP